jgi:hypothetical protein
LRSFEQPFEAIEANVTAAGIFGEAKFKRGSFFVLNDRGTDRSVMVTSTLGNADV